MRKVIVFCLFFFVFAFTSVCIAQNPDKYARANLIYGGGAGGVGFDFIRPINQDNNFRLGIGYLQGNQYNVLCAGLAGIRAFGNRYAGLGVTYAGYSENVADIPGLSGTVTQGGHVGLDLFTGVNLTDDKALEVGYSSALGFTGRAVFKF